MLAQVISSWQVWAVTVVLVVYIFLVNYVARIRNRSGKPFVSKDKRKKKAPKGKPIEAAEDDVDLGLDDTVKR